MPSAERSPRGSRRWTLGLPPRVAAGFGAAVACLALASVVSVLAVAKRSESAALVTHSGDNQLQIEEVESALLVSGTALDAFLATGEPRYRTLYERASAKFDPALARLQELAGSESGERFELEKLLPDVSIARTESAEVFALANAGDLAAARTLRTRGVGREAAARAKDTAERLEDMEEAQIARQQAHLDRDVLASNVVFAVAVVVLFVLIALAARVARDEFRARERNEQDRARALEVQQRLMAVVSHDLRNPLTGILTAGWSLARSGLPRESHVLARRIVTAGRRMERLIRDLLDWSRVHAGAAVPLTPCDADVYDVCQRITEEFSERQGDRIQLERDGDTRAVFDPDRMEQVVANLVVNALKYSPPETRVRVRAVGAPAEVRLEVLDQGPGIPPETRRDLFEPFRRGGNGDARDGSGLGLGLFIVRSLTEAQGGHIEVTSEPGQGTTFVVRLPRVDARHAGSALQA